MLHFAYKYGGDFKKCLVESVNTGGENVARGGTLGALLGAAHGASRIPRDLKRGLKHSRQLRRDIDAFVAALLTPALPKEPKDHSQNADQGKAAEARCDKQQETKTVIKDELALAPEGPELGGPLGEAEQAHGTLTAVEEHAPSWHRTAGSDDLVDEVMNNHRGPRIISL